MTIFEEYLSLRKKEIKLEMNYLCSFHNCSNNMCDISKAKADLHSCAQLLKDYDAVCKERENSGKKICDLSYVGYEKSFILCKFLKFICGEDYEFKSLVINNMRKIFLIKKGASLDFNLTMDNLLTNESIIVLTNTSSNYLKGCFNLYQYNETTGEVYCEISDNEYLDTNHNDAKVLKEFIDKFIIAKSQKEDLTLEEYFDNYLVNYLRQTSNEEGLFEYYNSAYQIYDKEEQRRSKRMLNTYYQKKQRESKNKVMNRRKLGQLPDKYMPKEDVESLTFIRRLELMLRRKFNSIEKDTINTWLIFGFNEEIIMEAYKEASIRGDYNTSTIATILKGLLSKEDIVGLTKTFPKNNKF